ncbi:hypothetical protein BDV19DRAFT_387350 [Aspergillus venezuelensis]
MTGFKWAFFIATILSNGPVGGSLLKRAGQDSGTWRGRLPDTSSDNAPRFRYWWPGGWIDPGVVRDEVKAIALAGFGGAEIGDVRDSISEAMNPAIYGWAQERWNAGVLAAYEAANEHGIHIDYTIGPHWPTGVPGYTPDSAATAKELVHGQALVHAGVHYVGPLPLPDAKPSGQNNGNPNVTAAPQLVAVLAARTRTTNVNASVLAFDQPTVTDISRHYKNGELSWTAPHNGTYIVVAVYGRGTGQVQNMYDMNANGPQLTDPFPAYIVDHLSVAGVEATVAYWNDHILTDELRLLLKTSGGSLFEDSLELKMTQYWTPNFLQEFQKRRGYDLKPYILYVLKDTNTFSGDAYVARMVEYDFYSTVTDLYIEYRLNHLQKFAKSLGLKLRAQPYTATIDSTRAAASLDIAEGESLGFESAPDSFRVLATGRDVSGRTTILSNELGAYQGKAYGVTWSFLLGTANFDTALGASLSVIHGFPYSDSPTSVWPGFAPFTPLGSSSNGFADAWGPRQPQWRFARNASSYMAKSQELMQSGSASVDIAILNLDWGVTTKWDDAGLNDAGYSFQFPTPELLAAYSASVRDGRLVPDGPRYKALVINNVTSLNIDSARDILSYGNAGLPIVIVGTIPSQTQSLCTSCHDAEGELKNIFKSILALETTTQVKSMSKVPTALKSLGVNPLIQYTDATNATTVTTRRLLEGGEYVYWIYSSNRTSQTVYLEGEGYPLRLDLWTGGVSPIAAWVSADGYTAINLTIGENAAEVVYLGRENPYGFPNLERHIVSTDAEAMADDSGKLFVRAAKNGSFTALLSTDEIATPVFVSVPPAVTPESWTLIVEDWSPGTANSTGRGSAQTEKTTLAPITLSELTPWANISGLEYASGVGVYHTVVNLITQQDQENVGVYIDIGEVGGTWDLKVNGQVVPGVDWFRSAPLDVTPYIRRGDNEIEVTVATTLWNKLRKTWPDVYGSLEPQEIGLLGPFLVPMVRLSEVVIGYVFNDLLPLIFILNPSLQAGFCNQDSVQMESVQTLRTHISKACEACRQQKIKCSGESPCKRCSRLSLTCVVRKVTRQRQRQQQPLQVNTSSQYKDKASNEILRIALRPVRIRNEMTRSAVPRTTVYGPTSTVAVLHLIALGRSGHTAFLTEKKSVTNSDLSLEDFSYHLLALGSSLPLDSAVLPPPLCLTIIPKQLLEFFLIRYIRTAWGTVPIQSPGELTSLLQSSCRAFNQSALPPTFYPILLYQLAMGSLSTRHSELSDMLVKESSLFASAGGGYRYEGLTQEMELQLVVLMISIPFPFCLDIGNFNRAYEILADAQGLICTAGYHLDPQAQTPGVKRLLRTLLSLDIYVCIAVGRPSLLTSTMCLSAHDTDNDSPVSNFVSGLFNIINNNIRAQQEPDMPFDRLCDLAWKTHTELGSFWAKNQPVLQFAHADLGAEGGVTEEMALHAVLHQYAVLTNFRPFLLYLGYRSIIEGAQAQAGEESNSPSLKRSTALHEPEQELEPETEQPSTATPVRQKGNSNSNQVSDTRLSLFSTTKQIYTCASKIVFTLSKICRAGSLLKDLPMNSFFLETACLSLVCCGLWHGHGHERGRGHETYSDEQVWDAIDEGIRCLEALQNQKIACMRLAAVRAILKESNLQRPCPRSTLAG